MKDKTIAVIGSLGPEAILDFFSIVLARTPAQKDRDHLHLIITNKPEVRKNNEASSTTMRNLTDILVAREADGIIAGCTEVPLVFKQKQLGMPFINSTHVPRDAVFKFANIQEQRRSYVHQLPKKS